MPLIQGCVRAKIAMPIFLGRQGENNTTQVSFDISEWRNRFGTDGEIYLYHQRPKDIYPYRVPIEVDENEVYWNVSAVDTDQYARYGQAELRYVFDNKVIKSEVYRTSVYRSLAGFVEQYPSVIEPDDFTAKFAMVVTYVSRLPERGQENRLYMVPLSLLHTEENNKYDKYIWIEWEDRYEKINSSIAIESDGYDVFMTKMNDVMYNLTHSIDYGRFLVPDTTKIAHIKCLDESYWGENILLTYISAHTIPDEPTGDENESAEQSVEYSEVAYRVFVNENGWLELENSNTPTALDAINLTLIFAEEVGSIREERELAHNPIPLRLDYKNADWIDTIEIERQNYFEFLLLAGIEKTFVLLDPKPERAGYDWDEIYERCHCDIAGIYDIIHADENGYYYRRIYFENGIIPQDKDIYAAVYTKTQ